MNQKIESLLKSKAELIHGRLQKTEFSIITILTILQLLFALYRLFQSCNYSEQETEKALRKPNFLQRAMIRKLVKRSIPDEFTANDIYRVMMEVNKKVTKKEIKTLYNPESNDDN